MCTERPSDCGQAADASVFVCVAAEPYCISRGFSQRVLQEKIRIFATAGKIHRLEKADVQQGNDIKLLVEQN